jgi:4-hydroxybenzoate polyprenyltransferase
MQAIVAISLFIPFLLGLSYMINQSFFISALCYILLQAAYTFYLKHVVILDVFSTAFGFLLRVIAGAVAIQVEVSSWLLICTITLSLFLALSKRRHEVAGLTAGEQRFRKVLQEYNTYLLDQMISVASSATVVLYILYTLSDETLKRFGTRKLVYTVPPVLFGIFRYLYLIHKKKVGGNPETTLFNDLPLFIGIIAWIALVVLILYG